MLTSYVTKFLLKSKVGHRPRRGRPKRLNQAFSDFPPVTEDLVCLRLRKKVFAPRAGPRGRGRDRCCLRPQMVRHVGDGRRGGYRRQAGQVLARHGRLPVGLRPAEHKLAVEVVIVQPGRWRACLWQGRLGWREEFRPQAAVGGLLDH